jgi:hypothetical protein
MRSLKSWSAENPPLARILAVFVLAVGLSTLILSPIPIPLGLGVVITVCACIGISLLYLAARKPD